MKLEIDITKSKLAEIIIPSIEITEAISEGSKYKAIIIKAGQTDSANAFTQINGVQVPIYKYYTEEALQEAVEKGLFENIPAVWRSVEEHLEGANTGINQIVGAFTEVKWNDEQKCVEGIFNIKQGGSVAESFKSWLKNIYEKTKQIGLSISGIGKYVIEALKDKYVAVVTEIESLQSIDPVPVGNAGGKLIQLIESQINKTNFPNLTINEMNPELKKLIYDLLNGALLISEGTTVDNAKDDDLINGLYQYCLTLMYSGDLVTEAVKSQLEKINKLIVAESIRISPVIKHIVSEAASKHLKKEPEKTEPEKKEPENKTVQITESKVQEEANKVLNEAKLILCKTILTKKLSESRLPQIIKDKVEKQFRDKIFKESELDEVLKDEQKTSIV